MSADESDISGIKFDPGPKHSTPVKVCSRDVEQSVVAEQRREMELLVRELRERDQELNDLVTSHQHQLSMWEQDRQLILHLQHRCQCLEEDLQQQKKAVARWQTGECRNEQLLLKDTLGMMSTDNLKSAVQLEQLQSCNKNLNDSLRQVCTAKGQLEAREKELTTLLALKEKSLAKADEEIKKLRANLKLADIQREESQAAAEQLAEYWQEHCKSLKEENEKLLGACKEKDRQLQQATTQLHDTLQQALVLQQALCVSCEREKNKDELLKSVRARQERCAVELTQLKNLYRRQNREKTLLQLNLETSKEKVELEETSCGNTDSTLSSSQDSNPTDNYMLAAATGQQVARTSHQQLNCSNSADCLEKTNKVHFRKNTRDEKSESSHHNSSIRNSADVCKAKGSEHTKDMCQSDNYSQAHSTYSNTKYSCCGWHQSLGQSASDGHQTFLLPVSDHNNLSDENQDGFLKKEQDVDTEAFWLKIMSVRHGNQNSLPKKTPVKLWPGRPKVEMNVNSFDQFPVDGNARVPSAVVSGEGSLGMYRKWGTGPLSMEEKCTSPDAAALAHNAGAESKQINDGLCPTDSDDPPQHLYMSDFMTRDNSVVSTGWEQQHFCAQLKKNSILCKNVHGSEPQTPSGSQGHFRKTTAAASDRLLSHTEGSVVLGANREMEEDDRQPVPELQQYSHRDVAVAAPLAFEERLSSFLETGADDVSIDPLRFQGASSPASKLHRLLMESQEMIKGLEVTALHKNQ